MNRFLMLIGALIFCAGCSGDKNPASPLGVIVTGKVVRNGVPLTVEALPPGEVPAEVIFVPIGEGSAESEALAADGTFREAGWEKGIKPGKYKLAITHFVQGRESDGLQGAFSAESTPITVEIPSDKVGAEHDLGTIELNDHKRG
jgi:hypothetical protein